MGSEGERDLHKDGAQGEAGGRAMADGDTWTRVGGPLGAGELSSLQPHPESGKLRQVRRPSQGLPLGYHPDLHLESRKF